MVDVERAGKRMALANRIRQTQGEGPVFSETFFGHDTSGQKRIGYLPTYNDGIPGGKSSHPSATGTNGTGQTRDRARRLR